MELLVQERAEEVADVFFRAIAHGDWRAAESLLTRIYGRPKERIDVETPTSPEQIETLSLRQIRELRGRLELVRDDAESG